MEKKFAVQFIIAHLNDAKRDLEQLPKTGMSNKSITEMDLAYNLLNESINYCNESLDQHKQL